MSFDRPLHGVTVLEIAGLAPAPFCGMILADFGANVIRIDRTGESSSMDTLCRGKKSIALNLKSKDGIATLMRLIDKADVLIEPFRPGVAEKLGFGPEVALHRNHKLIYARLTGFGQSGPYAKMAGHDMNYIAISGALSLFGRKGEKPLFPVNILGDFAGGGMLCAMGVLLALYERTRSGKGQVIDAAMVDGAAYLSTFIYKFLARGMWGPRGTNMLDSGAHFYEVYKTKDNKYMSVGAIEPHFYSLLLKGLGIDPSSVPDQNDKDSWPAMKDKFQSIFEQKTQSEWAKIFDGTDACVVPILEMDEVMSHPHNKARELIVKSPEGKYEDPAPAPRLSRTPGKVHAQSELVPGQDTIVVLLKFGFSKEEIQSLIEKGVLSSVKASL